ncbi:mitochondrial carrier [Xylona heveae TC161]|uniref:Mitochondrial carrier n=1 Tax=Xylona heveae (strain CBS 132557 / TC161) TaxID=1328760 RepID=A0A161TQE9_XYLHT|nr:mitochondrial carrier [Xylona heveae TC161]KZF24556.1 mitochondrial carrier [Xylona heveae TC161]
MEEVIEQPDAGLKQTFKDLFSGAMGGVAQVLIGQPFDIVKVRLQTTSQYSSAADCATKILKNEGPLAFYKGTLTPLIGIGACVSIQFGGFHYARRQFEALNAARNPNGSSELSLTQFYLSGSFAGIANTVLSCPIEHVRIRLQTQPHGAGRLYSGPISCIRALSAHNGIGRGLFRGTSITLLREAHGYGTWFLAYEWLMNAECRRVNTPREQLPTWKVALAGGLAGEILWLASYPLDVIKSKMQSDGFGDKMKYKTMRDCFGKTWAEEGMRGFWKGIAPALLRALPVSAGTFAVVEMTMRAIN